MKKETTSSFLQLFFRFAPLAYWQLVRNYGISIGFIGYFLL